MTSFDQKQRERSVLDFYLHIIGLKGDVAQQERPDFIVRAGKRRIGVEITEYHQPKNFGQQFSRTLVEAEWQKIRAAVVEYRKTNLGLENLSVLLTFTDLKVPDRNLHQEFIQAVHEEIERLKPSLGVRFKTIRIDKSYPEVLFLYLKKIDVRVARCYLEWDWNHMVSGVGTSDHELKCILDPKPRLKRPDGIDELHLVMSGDGPTGGTYIGYLSPERLNEFTGLNEALDQSDFRILAILNYEETCIWQQDKGWSQIVHMKVPGTKFQDCLT